MTKIIITSFKPTNMESGEVQFFFKLLGWLLAFYIGGFILYLLLRITGESYPETWQSLTNQINAMPFDFDSTLDKARPLVFDSVVLLILAFIFYVLFRLLRLQILRTGLLAIALLSSTYLFCAIPLLLIENQALHLFLLGIVSVGFTSYFIIHSNLRIYLNDKTYPDVFIESVVAIIFLFFIGRMFVMALATG